MIFAAMTSPYVAHYQVTMLRDDDTTTTPHLQRYRAIMIRAPSDRGHGHGPQKDTKLESVRPLGPSARTLRLRKTESRAIAQFLLLNRYRQRVGAPAATRTKCRLPSDSYIEMTTSIVS